MQQEAEGCRTRVQWATLFVKLLRARVWTIRNTLLRAPEGKRHWVFWRVLLTLASPFIIGGMAYGIFGPMSFFAKVNKDAAVLLVGLPRLLLFGTFWMLTLSSVTVTIQRFYTSNETTLLVLAPVPIPTVFLAKFTDAVVANTASFLIVGVPAAAAYGLTRNLLSIPYLAETAGALILFGAVPTAIGAAVAFFVMRLLPPNRSREILGALGILLGAAIYLGMSVVMMQQSDDDALPPGLQNLSMLATSPWASHGPWAWAGTLIADPSGSHTAGSFLKLIAATLAVCWGAAWVAKRLFYTGWAAYQEVPQSRTNFQSSTLAWERHLRWMPAPMRGILLKDLMTIQRDLRQLSLLVIPVAASLVLMYNSLRFESAGSRIIGLVLGLYPVLAMIALRMSMSAFAMENRAMWLIAAAPPAPITVLLAKLLFAATLSFPLSMLISAAYAAAADLSAFQSCGVLTLSAVATASFCSIGVGTHGLYMDLRPGETETTMSGTGRTISMFIEMGYIAGLDGILILCSMLAGMHTISHTTAYVVAGGASLGWSGIWSVAVLAHGTRSFRRFEW